MTVVDDIRARLDIVDVVSEYVPLQKSGRSFKAPCPFHNERTPSFIVNPERQNWHCFGACSTGGDAFSFVMRSQNIEFPEALRILAQKAGVQLSSQNTQNSERRNKLHSVNRLAATFYQEQLHSPQGANALQYLKRRGVSPDMINAFQLGYAPARNALQNYLANIAIPVDDAVAAGVIYRNEQGRTWDFFRDRLIFPIHDRQANVIGFGGRLIAEPAPDSPGYNPKYINTARTPVFDKRSSLYGIHRAHSSIRQSNTGVIVEGYMDVIAAHQHGSQNVVASMGTALTENQVAQLKSLATNFILALDPDAAGQEATLRSLEASWKVIGVQSASRRSSQGMLNQRDPITLNIAALPEGKDPDELIRRNPSEWQQLISQAQPLMSYLIPTIAARFDATSGHGKTQVVEAIYPLIAATENPFDRQRYEQELANALDVTVEALLAALPHAQASTQRRQPAQPYNSNDQRQVAASALSPNREQVREDFLLALLLKLPQLREYLADFSPEYISSSANRELFARWLSCPNIAELEASLDEPLLAQLHSLTNIHMAPTDNAEGEKALRQCMRQLKRQHLLELQQTLLTTTDSTSPPPRELTTEISSLNAGIKAAELP